MVSFVFGSILQQLFLRYIQPQHSHFQGSLTKPLWCGVVKGMVHKSLGVHSVSGSTLHFRCCVGILGPHNKLPETGWFKTTEIDFFFFLQFWKVKVQNPGVAGCAPCEGFGEDAFLLSGWWWLWATLGLPPLGGAPPTLCTASPPCVP